MPTDKILTTLENPATTYWLRDAIKSALQRDPVDALHDAEELAYLLRDRLDQIISGPVEEPPKVFVLS